MTSNDDYGYNSFRDPNRFDFMWVPGGLPHEDFGFDIHAIGCTVPDVVIYLDDTAHERTSPEDCPFHTPIVIIRGKADSSDLTNYIPVTISRTPEILVPDELFRAKTDMGDEEWSKILNFISRNHDVLMDHWNGRITGMNITDYLM